MKEALGDEKAMENDAVATSAIEPSKCSKLIPASKAKYPNGSNAPHYEYNPSVMFSFVTAFAYMFKQLNPNLKRVLISMAINLDNASMDQLTHKVKAMLQGAISPELICSRGGVEFLTDSSQS